MCVRLHKPQLGATRIMLVSLLAASASLTAAWGQQTPVSKGGPEELLTELRSDNVEVRSEALEHLRTDPVALGDSKVKAALVALLDRENQVTCCEDEGYAEYVSWLSETVAKVVDWSDHRQVCILANSLVLSDELAGHAKVAVPCLLQRFKNGSTLLRGLIVGMLIQAVAKGKSDLDAATVQTVKQITLSALRDPDEGLKIPTVEALKLFGEADMIPALRVVAETDPDPSEHYAIRKWAAEAIATIQSRAQGPN